MRNTLIFVFITAGVFSFFIFSESFLSLGNNASNFLASTFFSDSLTTKKVREVYASSPFGPRRVKIVIVPGHDDDSWGTDFAGVKESTMNVILGEKLYEMLREDSRLEVFLVRDKSGYNGVFSDYFVKEKKSIENFILGHKLVMKNLIDNELINIVPGMVHNDVVNDVAIKLYGINKWANENNADIVLHIHFNDYPRKRMKIEGEHSGVAIYVPEKQYSNSKISRDVAESIWRELTKFYAPSDLPKEKEGIIEDQDLIAIGAYNTLDAAGLLVEYGYIYEPQFRNPKIREKIIEDLAFQTYLGLKSYFGVTDGPNTKQTIFLPHTWKDPIENGIENNFDVLVLQVALSSLGLYPPSGFDLHDCPISGNFKNCTKASVKTFKEKYGLNSNRYVDKETINRLNELFSQ